MTRRTKIVCTLGPRVGDEAGIRSLIAAGMNVARLNCSHGNWEEKRQWIDWVRAASPETAPVGILADLQGPKFRIGDVAGDGLSLVPGQTLTLGEGEADIPLHQREVLEVLCPDCRLLFGDGEIEVRVVDGGQGRFRAEALTGGILKSRKGVTVVGRTFNVPSLTEKDREDVREAAAAGADFIALSYVHSAADVRELRREVDRYDRRIQLVAKIETRDAVEEIDEILGVADVIMVARGDMGLQMDLDEVPLAQKRIIERCTNFGKPVITATQMLESMIVNPRPTRAEATDVFNAILDGTDAVMLSAETAVGRYPSEAVRIMGRIAERAETAFDHLKVLRSYERETDPPSHTEAVAHAVARLARDVRADAIVATTTSGQTARLVSKFRPAAPVLCATWNEKTQRQMSTVWGVEAILVPLPSTTDEIVAHAIDGFLRRKRLKVGDHVVITAGVPAGTPGNTNLIQIEVVK